MSEALSALDVSNVEVLVITSSSYRQNFCFLSANPNSAGPSNNWKRLLRSNLLTVYEADPGGFQRRAHSVVGEGMRGTPGLAGRIFTAISRHRINIIAIAQVRVRSRSHCRAPRRPGTRRPAVHEECGLGRNGEPPGSQINMVDGLKLEAA